MFPTIIWYNEEQMKQVIVVRNDLNMRKGKMIAQGAHASLNAYIQAMSYMKWRRNADQWMETGQTKIAVKGNSEKELFQIKEKCEQMDIPYYLVQDWGLTEFNGIATYTAICVGPYMKTEIDKITGGFDLL